MVRKHVFSLVAIGAFGLSGFAGCFLDSTAYPGDTSGSGGTGGADETGGTGGGGSNTGGTGGTTNSTGGAGGSPPCNDGDTQSCYSGPSDTKDVGVCKGGQQECADGAWGPCEGEVVPETDDLCDDLDSDCDNDDDVAEGCAAYEVVDSCHGVLLLDANDMIVTNGSSPDSATCFNGTVKAYIQPGDSLYILEDDSETVVKIWNIQSPTIGTRSQQVGSTFDHADMLQQYQGGAFGIAGLTQTVTPIANGDEYKLNVSGSSARPSFLFAF